MSVFAIDVRDALYKISVKDSCGISCPLLLTGVKRVGFATINGAAPRCPFAAATMMTTFSMHSELKMAYSPPLIPCIYNVQVYTAPRVHKKGRLE